MKAAVPDSTLARVGYGVPDVGPTYTAARAFVAEIVLTFFLMYVTFGSALDPRGPRAITPLAVALTIVMAVFAGGMVSGAAMNPSRHFGMGLVANHWHDWWIWYLGPCIGVGIASAVWYTVHGGDGERRAATSG